MEIYEDWQFRGDFFGLAIGGSRRCRARGTQHRSSRSRAGELWTTQTRFLDSLWFGDFFRGRDEDVEGNVEFAVGGREVDYYWVRAGRGGVVEDCVGDEAGSGEHCFSPGYAEGLGEHV